MLSRVNFLAAAVRISCAVRPLCAARPPPLFSVVGRAFMFAQCGMCRSAAAWVHVEHVLAYNCSRDYP